MNVKIGERYGRLTVKDLSQTRKNYAICVCDCGNIKEIKISSLQKVQSCGCKHRETISSNGRKTIAENSKKQIFINRHFNTNFQMIETGKPLKNNTSGVKGVIWNKNHQKYEAYISIHGKRKYLGNYDDLAEAEQARMAAEEKYYLPLIIQKDNFTKNIENYGNI